MSTFVALVNDILNGSAHFLGGLHKPSMSALQLIAAVTEWSSKLNRTPEEAMACLEPCIRQSILMTLLPAAAFDPSFGGSIDRAVTDHLTQLQITLPTPAIDKLRDICINIRKLRHMTSPQARAASRSLAQVRANPALFNQLLTRQNQRCLWCGILLAEPSVKMSLEHVAPKHIGDDMPNGSNWGISCTSCNSGKADVFAWSASAHAHDYVQRTDFQDPHSLSLNHRWTVLMRSPKCDACDATVLTTELFVYRRIRTGLPVPSNCSVTCRACAVARGVNTLRPRWAPEEAARTIP